VPAEHGGEGLERVPGDGAALVDCEVALRFGGYAAGSYEQAVARFAEALKDAMPNDRTEISDIGPLGTAFGGRTPMWKQRTS